MSLFKPIDTGAAFDPTVVTVEGTCERCSQGRLVTRCALVVAGIGSSSFSDDSVATEHKQDLGYACAECVTDLATGAKVLPQLQAEIHVLSKLADGAQRMRAAKLMVGGGRA